MKTVVLFAALAGCFVGAAFAQDVKTGTIVPFSGEKIDLSFVEIDGEIYISWEDLREAFPDWFIVNGEGEVELSSTLKLLLLAALAPRSDTTRSSSGRGSLGLSPSGNGCYDSFIKSVSRDGETIVLLDGSVWQVHFLDTLTTMLWLPVSMVSVCGGDRIVNSLGGQIARVTRIR